MLSCKDKICKAYKYSTNDYDNEYNFKIITLCELQTSAILVYEIRWSSGTSKF